MTLKSALHKSLGGIVGMLLTLVLGGLFMKQGFGGVLGISKIGGILDGMGRGLRNLSYQLPFAGIPIDPPQDAVLVYLDDISHIELNQPYNRAWDRSLHAQLLDRLREDGAKAAVFDIVFSDPGPDEEADRKLARAIADFGNVILAADSIRLQETGDQSTGNTYLGMVVKQPYEMLLEGAANIGIAEMHPDPDTFVRRHFAGVPDEIVSSLSWAAAELADAKITGDESRKFEQRWIRYYGPPGALPWVSFSKAIANNSADAPPGYFKDKVVFIGARLYTRYSGERKDEYRSPYTFWMDFGAAEQSKKYMSGVEIQATVFLNLLRGDWISRISPERDLLIILLAGGILGAALGYLRPYYSALLFISSITITTLVGYYLFVSHGLWFSWFVLVCVQIPAAIWGIAFNAWRLSIQNRLMAQSIAMYVSPRRVKQILQNPDKMLKPGADKQEVSILFSDIANFTSMSEGMDSDELARMMNQYFEAAVKHCIQREDVDGTVVKFIGDAIFAIWNAPDPQKNHHELACLGALLLRDQVTDFKFERRKDGLDLRTRIGLHCGVANVGNFGSSTRIDYTAIGENINLASRMEGLNKYLGTSVLITGDVYAHVKEKFVTRFCGRFQLKGFERAVDVHELLGTMDQAEASRAWREAYDSALKAFQAHDLDAAERGFECIRQMHPNDGPAGFFLKHIKELRAHPPDGSWTGTVELKEK